MSRAETIAAIAFTDAGEALGRRLGLFPSRGVKAADWARAHFDTCGALVFIGACGIAVRTVAPLLKGKAQDPAVVVLDEAGRFVIPILSGHLGGANALASRLASQLGAQAVLTTASDVRGIPAFDAWARENDCAVENPGAILPVARQTLSGGQVGVMITERALTPPFPVTLTLRPRTLVLGAGCKKGVDSARFEACVRGFLRENGLSPLSVRALATIDMKAEEEAFTTFCARYSLPLLTYSADALSRVEGVFSHSPFVEQVTGVGCVCERAAVCATGRPLLVGKTRYDGVTLALSGDETGL